MGIKSWKQEFYPISATRCSKKDALAHSLKKWEGLREKNVEKHELQIINGDLANKKDEIVFWVDDRSCALCHWYGNKGYGYCGACPLYAASTNINSPSYGCQMQFECFNDRNDPEPMIKLLKKAIKMVKKEAK